MRERYVLTRRGLIARSALLGGGLLAVPSTRGRAQAPAASRRVTAPYGAQVGDVTGDRAILWSRADREARMLVELSTSESFARSWTVQGPAALEDTDFTARLDLQGLPRASACSTACASSTWATSGRASPSPAACDPARRPGCRAVRLVGRHGGAGLGHQPGLRRHADLRDHAPGRAAVLHPFGRHDLRRRAGLCRGAQPGQQHLAGAGRQALAQPGHRGEAEGGGEPARVPRGLCLQPDGREPAALQCASPHVPAVGRP